MNLQQLNIKRQMSKTVAASKKIQKGCVMCPISSLLAGVTVPETFNADEL